LSGFNHFYSGLLSNYLELDHIGQKKPGSFLPGFKPLYNCITPITKILNYSGFNAAPTMLFTSWESKIARMTAGN